jgi:hypothetical protein
MAEVHVLKNTEQECVLKIYKTDNGGGTIQIELDEDYIKLPSETFVGTESEVTIKEIFWGAKSGKQIDISRVDDPVANTIHGHYYLFNSGSYVYTGFVDNTYANGAIRITADGPFHTILKLRKSGYS